MVYLCPFIAKTAATGSGRAKMDSQNKNQTAGKAQQASRQNTVGIDTDGEESSSSGKLHIFYRISGRFYRLVMYTVHIGLLCSRGCSH